MSLTQHMRRCCSFVALLSACGSEESASVGEGAAPAPLVVAAVAEASSALAARIGGDRVDVVWVDVHGLDSHHGRPDAQQLQSLQQADLILVHGIKASAWLQRVSLARSRLVDLFEPIEAQLITEQGEAHVHGPGGEHVHATLVPTVWLDPRLALEQAQVIHARLVAARPGDAATFDRGLQLLQQDLEQLDAALEAVAQVWRGRTVIAAQRDTPYLARRLGVESISIPWKNPVQPSMTEWQELRDALPAPGERWLLCSVAPAADVQKRLDDLQVRTVIIDPCRAPAGGATYVQRMTTNLEALKAASQSGP